MNVITDIATETVPLESLTEVKRSESPSSKTPVGAETRLFLRKAVAANLLSHAYVFRGTNTQVLYDEALYLAQLLNCENPLGGGGISLEGLPNPCGQCLSCRWISQNSHPGVMTVSRLTYGLDSDKPGTTPTQIRTGQIDALLKALSLSSPHTRVVIFVDADHRLEDSDTPDLEARHVPVPAEWKAMAKAGQTLSWKPLSRQTFNDSATNKLLKTLEEPPPRTLFLFLTDREEQLIATVVSRCQVLPFTTLSQTDDDSCTADREPELMGFLENCHPQANAYEVTQYFLKTLKPIWGEESLVMAALQAMLRQRFWQRVQTSLWQEAYPIYHQAMDALEKTLSQLKAKTNREQSVFQLVLGLCDLNARVLL